MYTDKQNQNSPTKTQYNILARQTKKSKIYVTVKKKTWNTCIPMADSCQCMAKPLQYYKLISLKLKLKYCD